MDMTDNIHIDLDNFLSEDNVKLMYLEFNKKSIKSIKIMDSIVQLQINDNSYSAPAAKEYVDGSLLILIKKVIKKLLRILHNKIKISYRTKTFNKIYIINRKDVDSYRDLISLTNQISENPKEIVVFIDWSPNLLEEFILSRFRIKCFNRPLRDMQNEMINLSEEIIFLAHNLKLKIKSSTKIGVENKFIEFNKNDLEQYVDFRKKQNKIIEIVINSEFPLELEKKPIGFQDRQDWQPKLLGQFVNKNVKNAFLLNNHDKISLDNIEEIINYGLNLVSLIDLNDIESSMRLVLPGLLTPFDPLKFEILVQQAISNSKCYRIRSNGTSFVHLHLCRTNLCEPELILNTSFYHFQGFNPRDSVNSVSAETLRTKRICMVLPPYSGASGGIVALYKLHDYLKENGYKVYVLPYNPTGVFPFYSGMNILFQEQVNFDLKDAVWIYSDTVSAIPVDANIQIQWLMNRTGNLPATSIGNFRIKPNYVFKYSDVISEEITNKLFISNFDFDLFYPRQYKSRIGPTFYLGKSSRLNVFEISNYFQKEYQIINRSFPFRKQLPDLLSASSILISFDTLSALNMEANLCGTPTLIVTSPKSQFKEVDIRRFELPTSGIIFDLEELDKVPKLDFNYHEYFKAEAIKLEKSTLGDFLSFLEKL